MKIYAHYGFCDFILCLGYKKEMIKEYFINYDRMMADITIELGGGIEIYGEHREKGWRITLADTGEESLKGARIKKIEKFIEDDTFMLTYGDGVADIDIGELLSFHKSHGKIGTVTGVRPPSRFGELAITGNRVTLFTEKPQVSTGLINGGFFVFDREIFSHLSEDPNCDFERGPLEDIARKGELMVYEHKGSWQCMDTLRDMEHLNRLWKENRAFWKVW
jgi:glucose-1-phosphate cytidylyltransferase